MFPVLRYLRVAILICLFLVLADPARADAGWMGFRNDSGTTLIIQETVSVGTGSRQSKPQKIFANETVRDTPPSGGAHRVFTIYDSAHPDKPLYTGRFPAPPANENVLYVIKLHKGELVIEPIKTAAATTTKTHPKR